MSDYRFDQARAIDEFRRLLIEEGVPADERRRRLYQRFGAAAEEKHKQTEHKDKR